MVYDPERGLIYRDEPSFFRKSKLSEDQYETFTPSKKTYDDEYKWDDVTWVENTKWTWIVWFGTVVIATAIYMYAFW
jgi:hypothetical protein